MKFHELTWPELDRIDRKSTLVLAPVGACEQHGPHSPTFTDSLLVGAVAEAAEARLNDRVLLLPVMWLGASEHHLPFGATLTARVETHITLLSELFRPLLSDGYGRLLVLNGHGGNTDPISVALRRLQREFPTALLTTAGYWELAEREIAEVCESPQTEPLHAGEVETSMMLVVRPELVRDVELVDYHQPLPEKLRGLHVVQDVSQCTRDGHEGYPSYGSAEKGKKFLHVCIQRVVEVCQELLEMPPPEIRTNS